jgi:hypothetical protein
MSLKGKMSSTMRPRCLAADYGDFSQLAEDEDGMVIFGIPGAQMTIYTNSSGD